MSRTTDRRTLLKGALVAGAGVWLGTESASAQSKSPNEKLNIAVVGVGGRGGANLQGVAGENIVALCDTDDNTLNGAAARFPKAQKYNDYRKLLEQKNIDAVVVSTPDHMHAPIAAAAIRLGKHVYCEKPLTHTVHEARVLRALAKEHRVATQMGNQGHSNPGARRTVELIESGSIGYIREIHAWTDRPIWPQGKDRPTDSPPVPSSLHWDLWLGAAPARPFNPAYQPFNWRGWWDFGTGALGDMACHVLDVAFWGLKLEHPLWIEAQSSPVKPDSPPEWSVITYQFPRRDALPPVRLTWYDGKKLPSQDLVYGEKLESNGSILVGDRGTLYLPDPYGASSKLLPSRRFEGFQTPPKRIPDVEEHHLDWIRACKESPDSRTEAGSNFQYATALTEMVLLGNLALRAGKRIEWDGPNARALNAPEVEPLIRKQYRKGYEL
jgi:predicted dehydrogenase